MNQVRHGFSVSFEFPVCFTEQTFAPGNRTLVDLLRSREPDRRHRLLVVIDAQVAAAHPSLSAECETYVAAHATQLDLAAPPAVVPGGEAVKNDLAHTLAVKNGSKRRALVVASKPGPESRTVMHA